MLIQNVIQGVLVNGSVGRVEEFCTVHEAIERAIDVAQIKMRDGHPYGSADPDSKGEYHIRREPIANMRPMNEAVFSKSQRFPLVRFTNGSQLLCAPLMFTVEGIMGNVEVSRMQVPLILAWALSVHKSQGQTLQRVKVDLGRTFEKGQGMSDPFSSGMTADLYCSLRRRLSSDVYGGSRDRKFPAIEVRPLSYR
ncbi:uncharacterized protein SCHCODRAFT_02152180 [Schizophyllum commune H4-8]|uniref:uncharacterized protein n=1 Tax=Schizophyllum commune (strain H4-8 / FGSC 9210) TaxID=578458 RepID=UPI00215E74FB|nr:uncharacterized protein SCHCODRAFT_02152180 [Schizophyllum commune H4-8]KAI5897908.1 hypothetical protein SCHCODRAFT_02152180 [Schizophyllum commune H4-8]